MGKKGLETKNSMSYRSGAFILTPFHAKSLAKVDLFSPSSNSVSAVSTCLLQRQQKLSFNANRNKGCEDIPSKNIS